MTAHQTITATQTDAETLTRRLAADGLARLVSL